MMKFNNSDLVHVYDNNGSYVGHMWYITFIHIHENEDSYRLELSEHNGPANIIEFDKMFEGLHSH